MTDPQIIPTHIAIIMDGNRRWAKEHGLPVLSGHQKVADEILEPLVEHAAERGVQYITFWAFSTENWNRDRAEVEGIMRIFKHVIGKRWARLHEKGVRIRTIGDLSKFSPDIQDSLHKVIEQTKDNKKITAVFALNYGGRDEVLRAIHSLPDAKTATMEELSNLLDTKGIPDPDLIIRTSGEQRLSGFLPWQGVYSELYFPTWFMPEFTAEKLDEAIAEFGQRKRRFGK
ncbi:di-trans,poly-cis-decaprenylcistransferase [Candidatus Woesebacteria bacterium]|jgi:undecaprenyl diphosphate synthase|nr:di-trans,poly-cis-decaprenylcistransferase [Candidatus Woesebacteria bacterium]